MALQGLTELTLGNVGEHFVLRFICSAVGDPVTEENSSSDSATWCSEVFRCMDVSSTIWEPYGKMCQVTPPLYGPAFHSLVSSHN